MSPPLQAKLLRMIQEGEVRPVGDVRSSKIDVRLIAATNRDLRLMAEEGGFRKDLYYRLSVICIHVPPLRERLEDIPSLVQAISTRLQQDKKLAHRPFEADALEPLLRYSWPGNVRELENMVERLLTFSTTKVTKVQVARELGAAVEGSAAGLPPGGIDLKETIDKLEGELVQNALRVSRNKSEAARMLRIDRTWFLRLLKKHALK
jgi:transcriptional regulator with PAS, ATPase and Fis domain